jgi:hypothetical protein
MMINPPYGERARSIYRQEGFSAEHQAALDANRTRTSIFTSGDHPHRMPPSWVQHP